MLQRVSSKKLVLQNLDRGPKVFWAFYVSKFYQLSGQKDPPHLFRNTPMTRKKLRRLRWRRLAKKFGIEPSLGSLHIKEAIQQKGIKGYPAPKHKKQLWEVQGQIKEMTQQLIKEWKEKVKAKNLEKEKQQKTDQQINQKDENVATVSTQQ